MGLAAGVEIIGGAKADAALRNAQRAIQPNPKASKILFFAADMIASEARSLAPTRLQSQSGPLGTTMQQGRLRRAIIARPLPIKADRQIGAIAKVNYSSRTIGVPIAPHAHLVEFGTKPHVIKAKKPGHFLSLFGGRVFRREVHHPGAQRHPFFKPAVRSKTPAARQYIVENVAQLIEQEALKA